MTHRTLTNALPRRTFHHTYRKPCFQIPERQILPMSTDIENTITHPNTPQTKVDASTQDTMNLVFTATNKILDALQNGEKTILRDVIDRVVFETKVQQSIVNGIVPMFIHQWANAGNGSVNKGRNGGIYKGSKQIRVDPRPRCETCNQVLRKK
jgi:hypothetical protein